MDGLGRETAVWPPRERGGGAYMQALDAASRAAAARSRGWDVLYGGAGRGGSAEADTSSIWANTGKAKGPFESLPEKRTSASFNPLLNVPQWFREYDYDPAGEGPWDVFWDRPIDTAWAGLIGLLARWDAPDYLPDAPADGGQVDALRHTIANIQLERAFGPEFARRITNAYEVSSYNRPGTRLMDLYNNFAGRWLSGQAKNEGRAASEIAIEALQKGYLQTSPYEVRDGIPHPSR